jgi:hypothetical protein
MIRSSDPPRTAALYRPDGRPLTWPYDDPRVTVAYRCRLLLNGTLIKVASEYVAGETRPVPVSDRGPGLIFVPVPEEEVRRLESLGARRIDIGQDRDKVSWVVLADPEDNEFCVLSPRLRISLGSLLR